MSERSVRLVALAIAIGLAMYAGQVVWRPWVSPRYAAFELAEYDGKGVTPWIPVAAKFWGNRIYAPLGEATNQFEELRAAPQDALTEILLGENAGNVAEVSEVLANSGNRGSRMVGFMAARKHGVSLPGEEALEVELRELAAKEVTTNDNDTILALQVVGHLAMPGMLRVVTYQAERQGAPSEVRRAACLALERIPEKSDAEEILRRLQEKDICLVGRK